MSQFEVCFEETIQDRFFLAERHCLFDRVSFNTPTEGTFCLLLFDIAGAKVRVLAWRE